jgi:hypothetical protein
MISLRYSEGAIVAQDIYRLEGLDWTPNCQGLEGGSNFAEVLCSPSILSAKAFSGEGKGGHLAHTIYQFLIVFDI